MATNLERRIEVLESGAYSDRAVAVIVRQIVSPGDLKPKNSYCRIEGVSYTRPGEETSDDFDARMLLLAEDCNRHLGRPIRLIRSPTDRQP